MEILRTVECDGGALKLISVMFSRQQRQCAQHSELSNHCMYAIYLLTVVRCEKSFRNANFDRKYVLRRLTNNIITRNLNIVKYTKKNLYYKSPHSKSFFLVTVKINVRFGFVIQLIY